MKLALKTIILGSLGALGYQLVRAERRSAGTNPSVPVEFCAEDAAIVEHALTHQLTMVSRERLYATLLACKHVLTQGVDGDFVECGVWRGGNSILAADVMQRAGARRNVYLFDTFAGMTAPSAEDVRARDGRDAKTDFVAGQKSTHNEWCYASLHEVKGNFAAHNLLGPHIRFVQGDVCKTLTDEANLPKSIAVLRLDTDWYESTRAELEVLYPRLSPGGVLIIDDYGHWGGAKKAVDEYFSHRRRPLLQYTDYTGRMGVKVA